MPQKCNMAKASDTLQWRKYVYMSNMNSLPQTMSPGVLYTVEDINDDAI